MKKLYIKEYPSVYVLMFIMMYLTKRFTIYNKLKSKSFWDCILIGRDQFCYRCRCQGFVLINKIAISKSENMTINEPLKSISHSRSAQIGGMGWSSLYSQSFRCGIRQWVRLLKVAVNVSGGEQTFPQIMADFLLSVH